MWIPEGITDNVVPGLDSILTYIQAKYPTITTLQNEINNINNNITNDITNIQTEINNIESTTSQNVSKNLSYHSSYTDFMYQRNNTNYNYDNRRKFIIQQNYFTYQRRGSSVDLQLQIQYLQQQINDMAVQIQNLTLGGGGSSGNDDGGGIAII